MFLQGKLPKGSGSITKENSKSIWYVKDTQGIPNGFQLLMTNGHSFVRSTSDGSIQTTSTRRESKRPNYRYQSTIEHSPAIIRVDLLIEIRELSFQQYDHLISIWNYCFAPLILRYSASYFSYWSLAALYYSYLRFLYKSNL